MSTGFEEHSDGSPLIEHRFAAMPPSPRTSPNHMSVEMVGFSGGPQVVRQRASSVDVLAAAAALPLEAPRPRAPHPGVLADGWSAYFKRVTAHFFVGEPGERPWMNVFMPFLFLAIAADKLKWSESLLFVFSLIAIVPFAERLGFVTEQLTIHTNETLGGLLNASFGNATEVIVAVFALKKGLYRLVQVSLLGSILSNLLLVLGMSFFLGGTRHSMQYFKVSSSSVNSGLLMLSVISIMYPAAIAASGVARNPGFSTLALSRFTSVVLLIVYVLFLAYQLKTHYHLYDDKVEVPASARTSAGASNDREAGGAGSENEDEDDGDDVPVLGFWGAVVGLGLVTVVIAILSDFTVKAIEDASKSWGVSNVFIGVIVIPIAGNAAEHASAVIFAMKNRMEISIGVAIGSSIQIALFVVPLLVVIGWGMGRPLSMDFQPFESVTLLLSVIIVATLIQKGESTWLSGAMLLASYLIVSAAFFVHKGDPEGE